MSEEVMEEAVEVPMEAVEPVEASEPEIPEPPTREELSIAIMEVKENVAATVEWLGSLLEASDGVIKQMLIDGSAYFKQVGGQLEDILILCDTKSEDLTVDLIRELGTPIMTIAQNVSGAHNAFTNGTIAADPTAVIRLEINTNILNGADVIISYLDHLVVSNNLIPAQPGMPGMPGMPLE